jgi:hypothetical protein
MVGGVKVVERRDTFRSTTSHSAATQAPIRKKTSSRSAIVVTEWFMTIDNSTIAGKEPFFKEHHQHPYLVPMG